MRIAALFEGLGENQAKAQAQGSLFLTERRKGQEDLDHDMNMGWGATLSGGKEWWTSDNWGLGVAGRFVYVQAREVTTECLFPGYSLSVAFSATYN